jgi:hypothetical protein
MSMDGVISSEAHRPCLLTNLRLPRRARELWAKVGDGVKG